MKRIICISIIIFIVISVFAETITLPSAEATIKYDLTTSAYLFGFSDTLEHAKAKKDEYTEKEEYSLSMLDRRFWYLNMMMHRLNVQHILIRQEFIWDIILREVFPLR